MSRIADHVGRVLGGRYRLLAPIGTGGSAHVYLAEDSTLRRRVAVKLLHAALADDESFLRRFRAEAQSAAALNHANVMRVFDWGEDEDGPYLVLEHLGGGSLRDVLSGGRTLTLAQAASVGVQAAKALDYAHRRGLVHRDIKPANLIFDDEGRLCIADFGVARALAEATWTEPTGSMVGTARYAAPEQARGGSIDGKADVYALALVLIEAVTGAVPFQSDTALATLMARVDTPVEVPESMGALGPVVAAAGRPDPAERPDAAEFARQLEAAARDLGEPEPLVLIDLTDSPTEALDAGDLTEIRRARLYDHEADAAADPPTGFGAPAPLKAGRKRRRWLVALVVLLAALVLAGGAYAAVQLTTPSHPVPNYQGKPLGEVQRSVDGLDFELAVERRFDEAVPKDVVLSQRPAPGAELKERKSVRVVVSNGPPPRPVPSLATLPEAQAVAALQGAGFVPSVVQAASETVAKGTVIDWTPKGTQPKGATITLTVSSGPPVVTIPELTGKSFEEASKALTDLGFSVLKREDFSDEVPEPGKVVSTRPSGGAAKGSQVTVTVSKGPKTVKVPDLVGLSVEQAKARLSGVGLVLGEVYGPPHKRVFSSDPGSGYELSRGSRVNVYTR